MAEGVRLAAAIKLHRAHLSSIIDKLIKHKRQSVMKTFIIYTFLAVCGFLFSNTAMAQDNTELSKYDTISMHVDGVCTMCKKRIETAAYDVKGVQSVDWHLDSGMLTAIVKRKKTTAKDIADALARVGHSSEHAEAVPEAYAELPDCCKYDDGVPKHHDKE